MAQANQQNATIKFGSNRFVCEADFTIIGLNDTGGVVIGATLPPTTQAVWIEFRQGGAFLNADISDADGELVAKVRNNVIEFNKENVYSVKTHPENQIPPERVVITNRYGETAIDLSLKEGVWEFNGDFFSQGQHIVATPEGLTLNPQTPQV
jgi:sporulation protein YlmC with PRC-barrel domain